MKKWALSIGAVFVLSLLTAACGETKVVEVPGETITVTESRRGAGRDDHGHRRS